MDKTPIHGDGVECCGFCGAIVSVWVVDGRREFECHYGKVGYPATCAGVPKQGEN